MLKSLNLSIFRAKWLRNGYENTLKIIKHLLNSIKITIEWRTDRDSNPGDGLPPTHFPGVRLRPLGHLSVGRGL